MEPVNGSASVPPPLKGPNNLLRNLLSSQRKIESRVNFVQRAFTAADTVFLEADLTAAPRRGFRATIMQLGRNANFVTLSSLLGSRDTERLARVAERLGIPPGQLEPLRPWLASIRLSLNSMAAQGFESRSGVDGIIADITRAAGKQLGYLETVQEQFEIFAALSPAAEKAFLMATVTQVEEGPSGGLAELVTA